MHTMNEDQNEIAEDNEYEIMQFVIDPKQGTMRLDQYLTDRIPKVSRHYIYIIKRNSPWCTVEFPTRIHFNL